MKYIFRTAAIFSLMLCASLFWTGCRLVANPAAAGYDVNDEAKRLGDIIGSRCVDVWDGKLHVLDDSNRYAPIKNLSVLKGYHISVLHLQIYRGEDLELLSGLPLESLCIERGNDLKDISALRGMRLSSLHLWHSSVRDLSPLAMMPLKELTVLDAPVKDISALKGMPLVSLRMDRTKVEDISPLKGMPIESLYMDGVKVKHGLEVLNDFPLRNLTIDGSFVANWDFIYNRKFRALVIRNGPKPDLARLRSMEFVDLVLEGVGIEDLTPLIGMKIPKTTIYGFSVSSNRISNIAPLVDMIDKGAMGTNDFYSVDISNNPITNIAALNMLPDNGCIYLDKDQYERAKGQVKRIEKFVNIGNLGFVD